MLYFAKRKIKFFCPKQQIRVHGLQFRVTDLEPDAMSPFGSAQTAHTDSHG